MNSSVYIFGDLGSGYTQYPDDYARDICRNFYEKTTAASQIVIHRNGVLMYYGYVRKLDDNRQYIGFCILTNGIMFPQVGSLFSVFENAVADMATRGEILGFNERGDIVAQVADLSEKEEAVARTTFALRGEISRLEADIRPLPPVSYAVSFHDSKTFCAGDDEEEIAQAASRYGYTCILKDGECDTAALSGYRNVIRKLHSDIEELSARNGELKSRYNALYARREQYRKVIALCLIITLCGAGLFFLKDRLDSTQENLSDANRTIQSKEKSISGMNSRIIRLKDSLQYEKMVRIAAENDFSSFKSMLNDMQPFIVKSTDFSFDTGWLSFDYYGLRNETVTLYAKAFNGDFSYSNSASMEVKKGNNTFSIYLNNNLNGATWYSFELLIGNKIIGGDRH